MDRRTFLAAAVGTTVLFVAPSLTAAASTTHAELCVLVEQSLGPWALHAWGQCIQLWAEHVDNVELHGWAAGWSRERALRHFADELLPECAGAFPPPPGTVGVNWTAVAAGRARQTARLEAERKGAQR